jgi:hypothetical protein
MKSKTPLPYDELQGASGARACKKQHPARRGCPQLAVGDAQLSPIVAAQLAVFSHALGPLKTENKPPMSALQLELWFALCVFIMAGRWLMCAPAVTTKPPLENGSTRAG